ncbi:MAG TPA: hypothetical protein VHU40_00515 [Polyangia bacterium]|jgi:hypothetical protein|nr:hypothetical protein [Polyangia bacterium]
MSGGSKRDWGHVIDVHIEEHELVSGQPMLYRDYDTRIRMAYDPEQMTEDAALTVLCLQLPRLSGAMAIHRQK